MGDEMKVMTNAPLAYDYGFSRSLYETVHKVGARKFRVRVVAIPDEHVGVQTDRYRSGMYAVFTES
jgi:hypothetical protein